MSYIFRGGEEERGSVRQGGYKWRPEAERFEAVDLARLKITINDGKIVVKSKLFP